MIVPASGIDCDAKSTTANFCSAFTETILGTVIPNSWGAGCACVLVGTGDVRLAADGPLAHPRKNSAAAELMITTRVTVSSFRFIWSFMTIIPETGAPGVIRTRDRRIRNPMLYPTELQAQTFILLGYTEIVRATPSCDDVHGVVVVKITWLTRTHQTLVPVGDCRCCSSHTDIYHAIFRRDGKQVKRSLKGRNGITDG